MNAPFRRQHYSSSSTIRLVLHIAMLPRGLQKTLGQFGRGGGKVSADGAIPGASR